MRTTSLHREGDLRVFCTKPGIKDAVSYVQSEVQGADLIEKAQYSDRLHIVKMHEALVTSDPIINIVREGLSANRVVSSLLERGGRSEDSPCSKLVTGARSFR
jgi:hypothetical protein